MWTVDGGSTHRCPSRFKAVVNQLRLVTQNNMYVENAYSSYFPLLLSFVSWIARMITFCYYADLPEENTENVLLFNLKCALLILECMYLDLHYHSIVSSVYPILFSVITMFHDTMICSTLVKVDDPYMSSKDTLYLYFNCCLL